MNVLTLAIFPMVLLELGEPNFVLQNLYFGHAKYKSYDAKRGKTVGGQSQKKGSRKKQSGNLPPFYLWGRSL